MNSNRSREQELQTIIKTQQSKILSLQKEVTMAQSQEKQHIAEALSSSQKIIDEKDRTIKMLMEQAEKSREDSKNSFSERMAKIEDMYRSSQDLIERQTQGQLEVEEQIARVKEHFQFELTKKEKEKEQLAYQVEIYQRERRGLFQEIQKLNKFYVESSRKQPEREETLLWVDKLIEFIAKTNEIIANESKEREQALLSITLHITQQMKQLNMEYLKNDTVITTERLKFLEELQDLLQKAEKDYNEAVKSNVEFGQTLSRVRNREEKQIVSKLESQLQQLKEAKEKELNIANQTIASIEKEKKSLLVNIQELKSYYELREKSSKEEIDFLKQTMEGLLESQEQRQKQFEKELARMSEQIEHLTVTFYEKIELPINAVYSKIKEEISKFKLHFEGFFSDSNLQQQIERFQLQIVLYLTQLNQQKEERDLIKETAKQALRIINFIISTHGHDRQATDRQNSTSPALFHSVPEKMEEKKLNYELATAKKQIEKLKEQNKFLQSKSPKNRTLTMNSDKLLELASQNELLKGRIEKLQRNQKDNFMYNEQILTQSRIGRINTAILENLDEKMTEILNFTSREQKYIISLSTCINSLNQIIINPVEAFQQLLNQIKSISIMPIIPHHQHDDIVSLLGETKIKKEAYREILIRKNESTINIHKTNVQLMKVIRQLLGKKEVKPSKTNQGELQNDKSRSWQSKQMLEKRVKEVHTQRLKIRGQMLQNFFLLEERVRTMEMKTNKKQNFPFIKFEESICKKLQEFFSTLGTKEKLKDIDKITKGALNDARSKLKDCQSENQGLIREITLLKQAKGFK